MAQPLFRAEAGNDLGIGGKADTVFLPVAGQDFLRKFSIPLETE